MSDAEFPHRMYPCDECPMLVDNADNPDSQFPSHRWDALSPAVRDPETGRHPGLRDPVFACHKGAPGAAERDLACAGWLAMFGTDHVRVRLALAQDQLPLSAVEPGANWPALHGSWAEVVANHTSDS